MKTLDRYMAGLLAHIGILLTLAGLANASRGDRSWFFFDCIKKCHIDQCENIIDVDFVSAQPLPQRWLNWPCKEECKYMCMWDTVEAFGKDGSPVPQFYGKWPFVRVWGAQEPASVIFSVLNGLAHLVMLLELRRQVSSKTPMYWVWHSYAIVCINTWIWSSIYHTRDTDFTEKMDYFCAFALVAYSWCMFCARVLGTEKKLRLLFCATGVLGFYSSHVYRMAFIHFDYGYNMKVNIAVGLSGSVAWILWAYTVRREQPYVWKVVVMLLLLMLCGTLELLDFPPLWWVFDAHSMWHASTVPLVVLWYSFVIDDCRYLATLQAKMAALPEYMQNPTQPDTKKTA